MANNAIASFSDSINNQIVYNATGSINRVNATSSYLLNNTIKYCFQRHDNKLNLSNSWVYGEQNNNKTNNDYVATADFNLYKTFDHFYYWGLGNYQSSFSLKIIDQWQGGMGVAYNVFDREEIKVNISEGMLFEKSALRINDTTIDQYQTFRNSFRLQFQWKLIKILSFSGLGLVQHSLNYGDDYLVKGNITGSVKILKWVSFTTAVNYNKVNKTDRETFLFTYGLTIDRYF